MSSSTPVLVVGSVALDSVRTPVGEIREGLGGSASYFGLAAVHYSPVRLVAVAGTDFPSAHLDLFRSRNLDTQGLELVDGKTFRWAGVYSEDMNLLYYYSNRLSGYGLSLLAQHGKTKLLRGENDEKGFLA